MRQRSVHSRLCKMTSALAHRADSTLSSVPVGCVPKKLMWVVTSSYERYEGFAGEKLAEKNSDAFDWAHIKMLRDKQVGPVHSVQRIWETKLTGLFSAL